MSSTITAVRLLSVPLTNDYIHTLYFANATAQTNYFASKVVKSGNDFSYQRKDKIIRYPLGVDSLRNCNYVMYQNSAFTDKWFYAFITNMEYINDEMTAISIETDVIQTWLFDYKIQPSFIEREHVDSDVTGEHTVPEQLETGEFVCNELIRDISMQDYVYVVQVTEDLNGGALYATNYGGVLCAGGAYICSTGLELVSIVNEYANKGKADAVFSVYLIPKTIITNTSETLLYSGQDSPTTYNVSFAKQTDLDGYEPRNKKLLCYPYNYILLSNNSGSSNILQYEHFSTTDCKFEVAGVPTVGGSVKCSPLNYKGLERMQQEGLVLGKFPTCSWSADLYTNWLTQNAVNIGLGVASGGLQVVGGAVGGSPASIANGALAIAQTVGQVHQMSFTPNSARGNTNGGDINTCYKMNLFYFHKMSIKSEYARIIDGYFDMYGYKVNRVGVPSHGHRENYWYTKTIDVNITGNVPMDDMRKIKDCYNRGITFWYTPANIGNYSVTNECCG
ncbi:MAG: hypothetical protein IJX16_00195 [Clostridia bacterium]|nr:hypothetical protein [Clostridia bacterium]